MPAKTFVGRGISAGSPRVGLFLRGGSYAYQDEIVAGAHEECSAHGVNLTCLSGRCLDTAAAAGGRAGLGGAGGGSGADAGLDLGRPGGAEKDLSSRGCGCAIRDADRQGAGIAMTVVAIALVLARRRTKRKRAETDRALLGRGEDHGHGRPGTTAEHGHSLW